MHLKSLTLRGFKSFASSTTLRFEPGITCVVGPNGSGKSNVVDALVWVMGEQGAKSLRGGKMEDVIFAGTPSRPALGRAEVVLTIDNADGALPIEYSEVTISRTMFRNGGSEYAINGQNCRLLDVQELLSDSGIGREMHVVVGQGQLDAVFLASPEDRRGFIEEAAGVLKHRKRKEKALRKLDAMQVNLNRVQDLTAELRRQLGPLGKQAELARKAAVIQSDLRDSKLRLLADDVVQARANLDQEVADESALRARQEKMSTALDEGRAKEARLEKELSAAAPRLSRAQESWYRLSGLRERVRGTASLAAERARHLSSNAETSQTDRDPEQMERDAGEIRVQEQALNEQIATARANLEAAIHDRTKAETDVEAEERRIDGLARAAADRREGLARLTGKVDGLRRRAAAAEAEIGRLADTREEALKRSGEAEHEFTSLETTIAGLSVGEEGLDTEHEKAAAKLAAAEADVAGLEADHTAAERERVAADARHEALSASLTRKDGTEALLGSDDLSGVLGSVAALLSVESGWEAAVATALGLSSDAVAVASVDVAVDALRLLRDDDLGRAGLVVGTADDSRDDRAAWPSLPSGLRYLIDLIDAPDTIRHALAVHLRGVVAVDDLASARAVVEELPDIQAVTRDGDLLGATRAYGGSASAPSVLEVQASVDEAADRVTKTAQRADAVKQKLDGARQQRDVAASAEVAALNRLHESDAELSAVAEQLGQLGTAARSARQEAERLESAIAQGEAARERDLAELAELERRLAAAEAAGEGDDEPSTDERDQLTARMREARQRETESRLALRTSEERARALSGRADGLEQAARNAREAQAAARERAEQRARGAKVADVVASAAQVVIRRLDHSLDLADAERTDAETATAAKEQELSREREVVRKLAAELDEITSSVHRDELARAEQRLRVEGLEAKSLDEHGVDAETLVNEYGPHTLVPSPPTDDDQEQPEPVPYVRAQQVKRARAAERALTMLGKVNPLALEEFAALEERHAFLTEQVEDLKRTRKDLLDIVKEVDDRVQQVFTEAFEDTAREFEDVFQRLFPGGDGRLVLTNPDDMLNTGIDVEARPPGKRVKRLSLLSGGERSLVAVGFLVALFKARPSPFYIMDEVEAALDDTNLDRLHGIFDELRENSQLIVITHQKSTMEIADALYGASMRGDGVTKVISQRIRESEPV